MNRMIHHCHCPLNTDLCWSLVAHRSVLESKGYGLAITALLLHHHPIPARPTMGSFNQVDLKLIGDCLNSTGCVVGELIWSLNDVDVIPNTNFAVNLMAVAWSNKFRSLECCLAFGLGQ